MPARRSIPMTAARRFGFTMTEILIVISLIVLMLGLAVPAFNLIRGGRSTDAAENQVAAMLGHARADAIGLQQPHGVMFFIDPATDRVNVAEVYAADYPEAGNPTRDVYLDLVPDVDYLALPAGVLGFVLSDAGVQPGTSQRNADGYIGFNNTYFSTGSGAATGVFAGGVILFNADGQIISRTYGFRTVLNNKNTSMQTLIGLAGANGFIDPGSAAFAAGAGPRSALGFVLCDRESFKGAGGTVEDPLLTGTAYGAAELGEEKWLDDNSSQLIVNRYNATLTRAD